MELKKLLLLFLICYTTSLLSEINTEPDQPSVPSYIDQESEKGNDLLLDPSDYPPEEAQCDCDCVPSGSNSPYFIPECEADEIYIDPRFPKKKQNQPIEIRNEDIRYREEYFHPKNTYFKSTNKPIDPELARSVLAQAPQRIKKMIHGVRFPVWGITSESQNLLLLVGPPGSGKSTLARAIAHELNIPYTLMQAALLSNEYKKSGEQNLMRTIAPILEQHHPHMIIIEELNTLTDKHGEKRHGDQDVATALWAILDEVVERQDIIFIATTNDIGKLPDQLKSRFGDPIKIPLPDKKQRKEVIQHYLPKNKEYEKFVHYLVYQTRNRSIREIKKLINEAIANARFRQYDIISLELEDFSLGKDLDYTLKDAETRVEDRGLQTSGWITLKERKKLISYYLPPNHQCGDELLDKLALLTEGKSAAVIREMCYIALSNAYVREVDKLNLTFADFKNTALKNWYSWYHPYCAIEKIKPHMSPFLKTAYPIILQSITAGISIYYFWNYPPKSGNDPVKV